MFTANEDHAQRIALTARYMTDAKNQTRVLRSKGQLRHAPHMDAQFARMVAQLRANDALRHGDPRDLVSGEK